MIKEVARFTIVSSSDNKLTALVEFGMDLVAGSVRKENATGILVDLVENKFMFISREVSPFNDITALNDYYADLSLEEIGKIVTV